MRKLLKHDFVRFCIVGASGFVINLILLTLFYKILGSPLFVAQIIASEIALFSNFMFHHKWTYKENKVRKTITSLIVQFHLTSWIAVVGSAFLVTFGVHVLHLPYIIALALSAAIALFWNFAWSKFVIWRDHSTVSVHGKNMEEI